MKPIIMKMVLLNTQQTHILSSNNGITTKANILYNKSGVDYKGWQNKCKFMILVIGLR